MNFPKLSSWETSSIHLKIKVASYNQNWHCSIFNSIALSKLEKIKVHMMGVRQYRGNISQSKETDFEYHPHGTFTAGKYRRAYLVNPRDCTDITARSYRAPRKALAVTSQCMGRFTLGYHCRQVTFLYIFFWAASMEPKTGEQQPTMGLNDDLSEPTPQISLQVRPVDQVTLMTNMLPLSPCLFQTPYSCSCSPTAALQVSLPCFPSYSQRKPQ